MSAGVAKTGPRFMSGGLALLLLVVWASCCRGQVTPGFVLGGRSNAGVNKAVAAFSPDGLSWTRVSRDLSGQAHVRAVAYSPELDRWVVAGNTLPTFSCPCMGWSPNGTAFFEADEPSPTSISSGAGVAWGYNAQTQTGQFLATGMRTALGQAGETKAFLFLVTRLPKSGLCVLCAHFSDCTNYSTLSNY